VITKLSVQSLPEDGWKSKLEVEEVRLGYKWKDLLDGKVTINQIQVIRPHIQLWKNAQDEWDFKSVLVGAQAASEISSNIQPKESHFKVEFNVDQLLVQEANIEGFFSDGTSLFRTERLDLKGRTVTTSAGLQASGNISMEKLILLGAYELSEVTTPFSYENDKLVLSGIRGGCYGGDFTGTTELVLGGAAQTFTINYKLDGVSLEVYQKAKGRTPYVTGALKADIGLHGTLAEPKQAQGNGSFAVTDMKLNQIKGMDVFFALLNVPELKDQTFAQTQGTFKIENQQITFYKIEATSPVTQLTGSGTVGFDQSLNMDCMIALLPSIAKKIPENVKSQLQQREDGASTLVFKVYGTTSSPQTNLMEKVGGSVLQKEVIAPLFNKLFKKKSNDQSQQSAPSPAAPAAPSESIPLPQYSESLPPAQSSETLKTQPMSSESIPTQPYQPGEGQ
jgi:uncharacterized protein involved in outer membrane biogenesis